MKYLLLYDYVDDMVVKRDAVRPIHLALVREWYGTGRLVSAGAFDPLDGAALVFDVESAADVQKFVDTDPYVKTGLVTNYRIRGWTVVTPQS